MREIKLRAWDKERQQMFTHPKWVEFQVNLHGVLTAKNFAPPPPRGEQQLRVMK